MSSSVYSLANDCICICTITSYIEHYSLFCARLSAGNDNAGLSMRRIVAFACGNFALLRVLLA
jgi:hypothetical protein